MLRVLYLTALESPDTGIIQNQVYSLMSKVARQDKTLKIHILSLLPINNYIRLHTSIGYFIESQRKRTAKLQELRKRGVNLFFFPLLMDGRNFYMKAHELLFFVNQAFFVLLYHTFKYRIELIHARSYPSALVALCIKKIVGVEYILDPRGIYPEEGIVHRKFSPKSISYRIWKRLERLLLREAAYVVACSTSLADHLKSICKRINVDVIPNSVDMSIFHHSRESRLTMRKKYNLDSKFVSVFSGELGTWTNIERLAQTFLSIQEVKKDAILLILTGNKRCTPDLFAPYGVDRTSIRILHLEPNEVRWYLIMGDIGLIVRNEDLVNQVAFPTKFAEYLACGLPVLSDFNVRDIADLIEKYQCGVTVRNLDEGEITGKLRILLRKHAEFQKNGYKLVNSYLSMSRCAKEYCELYKKICA